MKKDFDKIFIDFIDFETACKHCRKTFSFNNKLHYHLRHDQYIKKFFEKSVTLKTITKSINEFVFKTTSYPIDIADFLSQIIVSFVFIKDLDYDIEFRNWNFLKTLIKFFVADSDTYVCIDINCDATLENKLFVTNKYFEIKIHIMIFSL